ncbi:MAG: 4Fe-4S dicluster domain-containing protein [Chloroflexi bacterium]|nr:4Fe-4S dicluster domain-containing protein [Chloroflexota bacterium]
MAYVVTGNCDGCRFTDCVEVCPVNCFYGDEKMLYINPDECIDCDACVPACPVEAIFAQDDVPADQKDWIAVNADKTRAGTYRVKCNLQLAIDECPVKRGDDEPDAFGAVGKLEPGGGKFVAERLLTDHKQAAAWRFFQQPAHHHKRRVDDIFEPRRHSQRGELRGILGACTRRIIR